MPKRRFLLPANFSLAGRRFEQFQIDDVVSLRGDEHHHLKNVVRFRQGDQVILGARGHRQSFIATIHNQSSEQTDLTLNTILESEELPQTFLIVGIVRAPLLDEIVRKSVEVGVSELHFFRAEHSQYEIASDKHAAKVERWQRLLDTANKQSGAQIWPVIRIYDSLSATLSALATEKNSTRKLLCSPAASDRRPNTQVTDITGFFQTSAQQQNPRLEPQSESVENYIIVGPEGGLSHSEQQLALEHGFSAVSLGPTILRTETAAIVAAAIANSFFAKGYS